MIDHNYTSLSQPSIKTNPSQIKADLTYVPLESSMYGESDNSPIGQDESSSYAEDYVDNLDVQLITNGSFNLRNLPSVHYSAMVQREIFADVEEAKLTTALICT